MKKLILILLLLLPAIATAEGTPDGVTPANENICDVVQGGTPSLYGLCVAFCEAQDHFDPAVPVTQEELDAYLDGEARAKNSYNKYQARKQPSDPDMPCVVIAQDECPCWTEQELVDYTSAGFNTFSNTSFVKVLINSSNSGVGMASFAVIESKRRPGCRASLRQGDGSVLRRSVSLDEGELAVCRTSLLNRASELGL